MDVRRRCDTGGEEVPPVPPLPTSINRNIGDDDRAHARDPALPVTILGVVHRPDRFAMPAVWERENWHDALARLEGRVREPHPLLVKRGFGEFVEGLVDQVENKNEDDGRELGGRGDAWLSRDNSFVDLWESKQVCC